MRPLIPLVMSLVVALAASGCSSPWEDYDESQYHLIRDATKEAFEEHLTLLKEIITDAEDRETAPPPGVCAEYGYYLAGREQSEEGLVYLDREAEYYPEAETFVELMKRMIREEGPVIGTEEESGGEP